MWLLMSQQAQITTDEVARLLGRSKATVKRQAKAGTLPVAFKFQGRTGAYVFSRDAIEAIADDDGAA